MQHALERQIRPSGTIAKEILALKMVHDSRPSLQTGEQTYPCLTETPPPSYNEWKNVDCKGNAFQKQRSGLRMQGDSEILLLTLLFRRLVSRSCTSISHSHDLMLLRLHQRKGSGGGHENQDGLSNRHWLHVSSSLTVWCRCALGRASECLGIREVKSPCQSDNLTASLASNLFPSMEPS